MSKQGYSTQELVAAVVSGVIVLSMIVYWIVQIYGVHQMFQLAAEG